MLYVVSISFFLSLCHLIFIRTRPSSPRGRGDCYDKCSTGCQVPLQHRFSYQESSAGSCQWLVSSVWRCGFSLGFHPSQLRSFPLGMTPSASYWDTVKMYATGLHTMFCLRTLTASQNTYWSARVLRFAVHLPSSSSSSLTFLYKMAPAPPPLLRLDPLLRFCPRLYDPFGKLTFIRTVWYRY